MADHRNPSNPSRKRNLDPTYDVHDEDPLVELARIVSEEGGYLNISEDRSSKAAVEARARDVNVQPEPDLAPSVEDTELSLENQLMEELEISMAPSSLEIDSYKVEEPYKDEHQFYAREPDPRSEDLTTDNVAPEEGAASEFAPGEFASGEFTSGDFGSGEIAPGEIAPGEFASGEFAPGAFAPGEFAAGEIAEEDYGAEEYGADDYDVEGYADENFAVEEDIPVEGDAVQDSEILEPSDADQERSEYSYDAGDDLSSEVSELLSEQELSELEMALAEAEGLEDGEAGAQFDDDMGLAGDLDFGEIPEEVDDLDDSIYAIPPVSTGAEFEGNESRREGRSGRKIFAIAAVLSIAVLGGGVLMMMNSTSDNMLASAPPVFKAGDGPVKVAPETDSEVASNEKQTVFDVASTDADPAKEELVERSEKPVDRIVPLGTANGTEGLRGTGGSDVKDSARLSGQASDTATDSGSTPIGPKQVTTVKVNADGRIIRPSLDETGPTAQVDEEPIIVGGLPAPVTESTPTAVAVDESRPVPVRVVEVKPKPSNIGVNGDETAAPSVALVPETSTGLTDQAADAVSAAEPVENAIPRARPDETPRIEVAAAQPARNSGLVAQPAQQDSSGPVNLLSSNSRSQRVAAPAAPANTGSTNAGSGYLVQLSAQRSESQALAAFDGMKRQFPSLLGDYQPSIQRADLGDRGIYYRVRVGPMASQSAANAFCEQLKSSGGNCFVTR